jgi:hypothetical protein
MLFQRMLLTVVIRVLTIAGALMVAVLATLFHVEVALVLVLARSAVIQRYHLNKLKQDFDHYRL